MQRIKHLQLQLNPTAQYEKVLVETLDQVGVIYLNSPNDLNALSAQMRSDISKAALEFDGDDNIKVIVILSKVAKAFCAGADIKEFLNNSYEKELTHWSFGELATTLGSLRKILISGVNGLALGGGLELALYSDILICSEEAQMGLPEVKLGLIPGINGTQRLTKIVGKTQAMRYILTGDFFNAQTAQDMGLVSQIVKKESLKEECFKLANKVAEKSLYTLIIAKEAVKQAEEVGLSQGNKFERMVFSSLHNTQGSKEGIKAFVEKRPANFKKI